MVPINLYLTIASLIINKNLVFGNNDGASNYRSVIDNFSNMIHSLPEEIATLDSIIEKVRDDAKYDFVVIGSGSAGAVIANRLSEIPEWTILLLEAGDPETIINKIPLIAPILQFTNYSWGYTMEPQKNMCQAMEHKRCPWPMGKALGGSSSINYMIYTRGNRLDYDRWAALGNPGWSYDEVFPYFLKSEDCRLKQFEPDYHNQGGYLSVEDTYTNPLTGSFLRAGQEIGYKTLDYNGEQDMGFSAFQGTLKMGRRHSVSSAFLEPIKKRTNLHILVGARVTKILIDPSTKTAFGVDYVKHGIKRRVMVKKEVTVSAGVYHSPQLLMLSGIGPEQHLIDKGITPLQNLPVGQTLYDHLMFPGLILNLNVTKEHILSLFDPIRVLKWYLTGVGPFASLGGLDALGFVKTNASKEEVDYPDIELMLLGVGSVHSDYGLINRRVVRMTDEFYYKSFGSLQGMPSCIIVPILLHPESSGRLLLRSKNPFDAPVLYGNYLSDPEGHDLKTLIAAIRLIIQLSETNAFKQFNARLNTKPLFGCETIPFNSDEYWRCAIQRMATTLYHQTSTCRMGPPNDTAAVVNHELKVYGIQNLRVADSSVLPFSLSAHTNAPTIMIGEKTSDIIKKHWGML